jgi:hypothetical protein
MPRRVSSKGDRDDEAMPPRVKPKARRRKAAVRRGNCRSIDSLSVNNIDDGAEGVQQSNKDEDIRPPRERRRASSRRNMGPHREDSDDEEAYSPSQDSDNERDA